MRLDWTHEVLSKKLVGILGEHVMGPVDEIVKLSDLSNLSFS